LNFIFKSMVCPARERAAQHSAIGEPVSIVR